MLEPLSPVPAETVRAELPPPGPRRDLLPPPLLASGLDAWLEQRRGAADEPLLADFVGRVLAAEPALRRLVGVIDRAILFGEVDDAVWLAEQLDQRRRHIAAWARLVTSGIKGPPISAEELIAKLRLVDDRAKDLKPQAVAERFGAFGKPKGKRLGIATPAALAARLAFDCKAFGFKSAREAKKEFIRMGGSRAPQ